MAARMASEPMRARRPRPRAEDARMDMDERPKKCRRLRERRRRSGSGCWGNARSGGDRASDGVRHVVDPVASKRRDRRAGIGTTAPCGAAHRWSEHRRRHAPMHSRGIRVPFVLDDRRAKPLIVKVGPAAAKKGRVRRTRPRLQPRPADSGRNGRSPASARARASTARAASVWPSAPNSRACISAQSKS